MHDGRLLRVGREVFLAALGLPLETLDDWVIDRLQRPSWRPIVKFNAGYDLRLDSFATRPCLAVPPPNSLLPVSPPPCSILSASAPFFRRSAGA